LEIARQHQAGKNALSQENEALRRKLADISNDDDDENNNNNGKHTLHRLKRQRTHNVSPTTSDDETVDDASRAQPVEDEFVNNMGHKFCIIYTLWVHKGVDIFKIKFDDAYDSTERFENDDTITQGQLQEIVHLLKEQLSHDATLGQKWVCWQVWGC